MVTGAKRTVPLNFIWKFEKDNQFPNDFIFLYLSSWCQHTPLRVKKLPCNPVVDNVNGVCVFAPWRSDHEICRFDVAVKKAKIVQFFDRVNRLDGTIVGSVRAKNIKEKKLKIRPLQVTNLKILFLYARFMSPSDLPKSVMTMNILLLELCGSLWSMSVGKCCRSSGFALSAACNTRTSICSL